MKGDPSSNSRYGMCRLGSNASRARICAHTLCTFGKQHVVPTQGQPLSRLIPAVLYVPGVLALVNHCLLTARLHFHGLTDFALTSYEVPLMRLMRMMVD